MTNEKYMFLKTRLIRSIGFKLLIILIFIDYVPQAIFHYFLKEEIGEIYTTTDFNSLIVFPFIFIYLSSIILLDNILPHVNVKIFKIKRKTFDTFMLLILLFFLVSSIYFFNQYDISFRHTHRLHETGILIRIIPFLKSISIIYVLYLFSVIIERQKLSLLQRINILLIFISFLLSITSALETIFMFILILLLLPTDRIYRICTSKLGALKFIIFACFLFLSSLAAVYIGFANKIGVDATNKLIFNIEGIGYIFTHVLVRISTYEETFLVMFYKYLYSSDIQIYLWEHILIVIKNRLASIVPIFTYDPYYITTINTVSYKLLFLSDIQKEGAGSTPGPLASMLFFPFFPLGLIIMSFYSLIVIRAFNKLFPNKINVLGLIILTYFFARFFESPINILYIIEPISVMFIIFIFIIYFVRFI